MLEIIHNAVFDVALEANSAALPELNNRVIFSLDQSMDYRLAVERFRTECCEGSESDSGVEQGGSEDILPFIAIARMPPQRQPNWFPGGKAVVNKNLVKGRPDYGKYTAVRFAVCFIEYTVRWYFGSEFDYNRVIEFFFLMYPESRHFLGIPIYFADNKNIKCDMYFGEFEEIQKIDAGTFDVNRLYTLQQTWRIQTHIVGMMEEGPLVLKPLVDFQAFKTASVFDEDLPEYAEEIDYTETFPIK